MIIIPRFKAPKVKGNFGASKYLSFSLIIWLLTSCGVYNAFNTIFSPFSEQQGEITQKVPRLEYQHSIPVIHLYGSPHEMGMQYGEILREPLKALELISEKLFPEKTLQRYLKMAREVKPMLPGETLAFISGMAESSGVDYQKLLAINTVPKTTCSVLAVWDEATPDGNLMMGRNADYAFKRINKALGILVVKHPEKGYGTVASSFLGLAGTFTGINEKGVCFGNMLVYNGFEDENNTSGVPVQVLMQQAAEQSGSAGEMTRYLTGGKHLTPVNVMCADSSEAFIAELGQENFAVREGSRGVLAASNYFHSSGMFNEVKTDPRFSSLMIKARKYFGSFSLENMKEAMHAARKPNENLQCILFEPAKMKIHISMNRVPASKGPFHTFNVTDLLNQ